MEKSFGIIPLKKENGSWFVFLVQLKRGSHFGFPKGHMIPGETALECAKRELYEETHLQVKVLFPFSSFIERYNFFRNGKKADKEVEYFLAEVEGEVRLQEEEILSGRWVALEVAESVVTYSESRRLCREVAKLL